MNKYLRYRELESFEFTHLVSLVIDRSKYEVSTPEDLQNLCCKILNALAVEKIVYKISSEQTEYSLSFVFLMNNLPIDEVPCLRPFGLCMVSKIEDTEEARKNAIMYFVRYL